MDDGAKKGSGFILCTDSFSREEVEFLVKALESNFNLDCSIHLQYGKSRIYIRAGSMNRFRELVQSYFHPSSL
jgi:hypothetical protein